MALLVDPFTSQELINATAITIPVVQQAAGIINTLYVVFGGIVGISIILFLFRWRETWMMRKRMQRIEEEVTRITAAVAEASAKLDKLIAKKKK